ncbi:aryl-sulfate sulfotransferase [bacterium]|nr:aryl-sulfate sulfotransferase [bacterium]
MSGCLIVTGEQSGPAAGQSIIADDRKTLVFEPSEAFLPGEKVTVCLKPVMQGNGPVSPDTVFHFFTARSAVPDIPVDGFAKSASRAEQDRVIEQTATGDPLILNGVSVPSDFPLVDVNINEDPAEGYLFLNTSWSSNPHYSMITDNTGAPVWYVRSQDNRQDFKVQPDGRLTMMIDGGFYNRHFIALDTTYTVVDTFYAPPGYYMDEHELQVLPNGHYLIIAKDDQVVDISAEVDGGRTDARVRGNSVVEMDAGDHPVFIWRSWDHYDIEDAVYEDLRNLYIDYAHMNAIDVDHDGHLLVSSRHLSEITKINRQTGAIMWRLGGENDEFEWTNDTDRISYQHCIRVLPDGHYLVFDNGNFHNPAYSRALEFAVDTLNRTVTRIWEYPESHNLFSPAMGSVQRLPGGHVGICWANQFLPKWTEVRQVHTKAFELDFVVHHESYRAYRFPWHGKAAVPYLLIEHGPERITLLFNKFGDADVTEYRIYGGHDPQPTQLMAVSTRPFVHFTDLENRQHYHFRVTAVDSRGTESGFSNEEHVLVQFFEPGENMVANGDFSHGLDQWEWLVHQGSAEILLNGAGEMQFHIQEIGTESWHIQAWHPNIQLIQGRTYRFEFDAYADQARAIGIEVEKNGDPYTGYSRIGGVWLSSKKKRYSYEFTMTEPTELKARVVVNAGASKQDVYIDNVLLTLVSSGIPASGENACTDYALEANFPNPFNASTSIPFTVPEKSRVVFTVTDLRGRRVHQEAAVQDPGRRVYRFHSEDLPSGIYFCRFETAGEKGTVAVRISRKMLILK